MHKSLYNIVGAGVLFLYGFSHIGFLFMPYDEHDLANAVFPFMTNWYVFLAAAVVELAAAAFCWIRRNRLEPSLVILFVVTIFVWYRTMMFIVHANSQCHCVGLLGQLLHLSKHQETVVPYITLALLFFMSRPGTLIKALSSKGSRLVTMLIVSLVLLPSKGHAELTEVEGKVYLSVLNPTTGKAFAKEASQCDFIVRFSDQTLFIRVECITFPGWWQEFYFDGKQAVTIFPKGRYWDGERPDQSTHIAFVDDKPEIILERTDYFGISILWLEYGLPISRRYHNNTNNESPLVWENTRRDPRAYGYEWIERENGSTLIAVRNSKLDHWDDWETRMRILLPTTTPDRNRFVLRKQEIKRTADGALVATFRIKRTQTLNAQKVPAEAEMDVLLDPLVKHPYVWRKYRTDAVDIRKVNDTSTVKLPVIDVPIEVRDYRYHRIQDSLCFESANYVLSPGTDWMSANDVALLQSRDAFFKNWYRKIPYSHVMGFAALGGLFLTATVLFRRVISLQGCSQKTKHNI